MRWPQLRAPVALSEGLGSVPSAHTMAHKHPSVDNYRGSDSISGFV